MSACYVAGRAHTFLSFFGGESERERKRVSESEHGGDNFGVWNETKLRLGPDDTLSDTAILGWLQLRWFYVLHQEDTFLSPPLMEGAV